MNDFTRILVVDDEPVILDSCTEILRREQREIAVAGDGERGLALVEEFRPDVVFVDLKMPGISGIEVLEMIEKIDPTIVTVVITGYATVDTAITAMKAGAYDFIPKPFTPDQLRLITDRALERRRLTLETIALRREKEALRENFAAIVSHELKSPLSAVQQNLFVLSHRLKDVADEEQREQLERMKGRISDLLKMIDTWLRSISSDLNGIRERFALLPISVPLTKAAESVQSHAIRKNVDVDVSVREPAEVFGDEVTLTEAFTNLIGNAVKYSYEGEKVSVEARPVDDGIAVAVSDSGVGIPNGDLAHVFDDFYRADTGSGSGGAGVGLAISRRIAEAHKGSISVTSEVGKGTTFTMVLPSEPWAAAEPDEPATGEADGREA